MENIKKMNLTDLKNKLVEFQELKEQEIKNKNFEKAAKIRDIERQFREAIEKLENRQKEKN